MKLNLSFFKCYSFKPHLLLWDFQDYCILMLMFVMVPSKLQVIFRENSGIVYNHWLNRLWIKWNHLFKKELKLTPVSNVTVPDYTAVAPCIVHWRTVLTESLQGFRKNYQGFHLNYNSTGQQGQILCFKGRIKK